MSLTPRSFFRVVAFAEAVTWTLLIVAMIAKYGFDAGPVPVKIAGPIHGFVFITYALTALVVGLNQRWPHRRTALAVLTAVVPYATIPFDLSVDRKGLLDGGWRTSTSGDARDRGRVDTVLRWMLARPAAFAGVFVAGAVVIMAVLLILGPPGSWGA